MKQKAILSFVLLLTCVVSFEPVLNREEDCKKSGCLLDISA